MSELRIEPLSLDEVVSLFRSASFPWWIAGGWGLDLFLGVPTRPHEDVDVLVRFPRWAPWGWSQRSACRSSPTKLCGIGRQALSSVVAGGHLPPEKLTPITHAAARSEPELHLAVRRFFAYPSAPRGAEGEREA